MKCPNCDIELERNYKFCKSCGFELREEKISKNQNIEIDEIASQNYIETKEKEALYDSQNISYDPNLIQAYANSLYAKASTYVFLNILSFGFSGVILGILIGSSTKTYKEDYTAIWIAILMIILGFMGYILGEFKANSIRLQAQLALCQKQIEENTKNLNSKTAQKVTI